MEEDQLSVVERMPCSTVYICRLDVSENTEKLYFRSLVAEKGGDSVECTRNKTRHESSKTD